MKHKINVNRKIRVFISSTFKDLNRERDYLIKFIFPQIEEYCAKRALEFTPIDLRWGITEEESQNAVVLNACFEEVNNSRPFFIGILGERYGWIPDITEIINIGVNFAHEQDWLLDRIVEGTSITELEFDYGVLRNMDIPYAAFFIRANQLTIDDDSREITGSIQEHKLKELKKRIRNQNKYPIYDFNNLEQFGAMVFYELKRMIELEYPITETDVDNALIAPHEESLVRRSAILCDISNSKENLHKWIDSLEKTLLITGAPGSGISTCVAYLISELRKEYCNYKVLYFDFECLSSDVNPIESFIAYISLECNVLPTDDWSLLAIDNASYLSIEEINKLTDWIDNQSINTHIMIVANEASPTYSHLLFRFKSPILNIHGLTESQRQEFIFKYLDRYHKHISSSQINKMATEIKLPVTILKLILDSIITYGDFNTINTHIDETIKNSNVIFWKLLPTFEKVYAQVGLHSEFSIGMIAISLTSEGISEYDIMNAFNISQARWSAVRPGILRFCKGSPNRLQLAYESWQKDVKMYWSTHVRAQVGKKITDYLLTNSTKNKARLIAAIYNDIWHLPFDCPETSNHPDKIAYEERIRIFSTSYDTIMSVSPGLIDGMYNLYTDDIAIHYDPLTNKSLLEKILYYTRLARTLSAFNKPQHAIQCYNQLANLLALINHPSQYLYLAYATFEQGQIKDTLKILRTSNILSEKPYHTIDPSTQLQALSLSIKAYCFSGQYDKMIDSINSLFNKLEHTTHFSNNEQREYGDKILSAILLGMRHLCMFGDKNTHALILKLYKELEDSIRTIGLESESTYEYNLGKAILACSYEDNESLLYWSHFAIQSAHRIYGSRTNNVFILKDNRSYQYCRAANLYAIAYWNLRKEYIDWNGHIYRQNFYEALNGERTVNNVNADSEVKNIANQENMWFLYAIRNIQPEFKQREIDLQIKKNIPSYEI